MEPILKRLSCPQGHYWESADSTDAPADDICPTCGCAPETVPLPALQLAPSAEPASSAAPAMPAGPPPLRDTRGRPVVTGYEVHEDQGRGPTGVTFYRARHVVIGRTVLLKVVFARDDPGQLAWGSLRGEASALGRVDHPNVVQIHDASERDRQLFYNAIEYVNGPTLAEALAGKPVPPREAALLLETLARAVAVAHDRGLVHRSLKPASILLAPVPRGEPGKSPAPLPMPPVCTIHGKPYLPKITDWGLGRRPVEGDVTDAELQGEHPSYLAPEQAWGRARDIGPPTDVYALGAVLYECLTGRPPFKEGSPSQTLDAVQCREPPPPSRLCRVGADFDAVCRRCMARSPRRRYARAVELAEDLQRFRAGRPVKARPVGGRAQLVRWLRRHAAAVVLLLLGAGLGLGLAKLIRQDRPLMPVRTSYATPRRAPPSPQIVEGDLRARQAVALARTGLADRALRDGDTQLALEFLNGCAPDVRHWEWHYLWRRAHGAAEMVICGTAEYRCLRVSPGGHYLAAAGEECPRGVHRNPVTDLWRARDGVRVRRVAGFSSVPVIAFWPHDGRLEMLEVAAAEDWTVHYCEPSTGRLLDSLRLGIGAGRPARLAYTPNELRRLVIDDTGQANLLDTTTNVYQWYGHPSSRRLSDPAPGPGPLARVVAMQAGGQRLAFLTPDGRHVCLEGNWRGAVGIELTGHTNLILDLASNVRSQRLATASRDGTVRLWDFAGQPVGVLRGHDNPVTAVTFSADGSRVASCAANGTVIVWETATGLEILRRKVAEGRPAAVAFSDDESLLAVAHGTRVTLWRGAELAQAREVVLPQ
jgi:hypothetical protein